MEPPPKRLHLSLEPPLPYLPDDEADNLFALRPRLLDITRESVRVYTRQDPEKSLSERLQRIWAERGDFSLVTTESIRNPPAELEEDGETGVEDLTLTAEGMQELQGTLLGSLDEARTQLITALDLLSILSPVTDPPAPDLPLPAGSIIITPAQPDPAPSLDTSLNPLARLPLATSLDYIKTSANAFFTASKSISREEDSSPVASTSTSSPSPIVVKPPSSGPTPADLWSTILHFHSSTSYKLLPLGAQRGASLNTAKGEERSAHQIGIFFGCEEGGQAFRRAAVSTVEDLVRVEGGRFSGRKMVVGLVIEGREDEVVLWDEGEEEMEEDVVEGKGKLRDIENLLGKRGRSAFAEEIFSIISEEARSNSALKARFISGNRSVGESISMEGNGWTLRITMLVAPKIKSTESPKLALLILALLRILLLSIFVQRRASFVNPVAARPLLGTISTFLNHHLRVKNLSLVLEGLRNELLERRIQSTIDSGQEEGGAEKMAALRIVRGEKDLGGRIVFRVGKYHTYHVTHSLPLPQSTPLSPLAVQQATAQSLVLHSPGSRPVSVPSLEHLEGFLREQFKSIVAPVSKDDEGEMEGVILK